MSDFIQLIILAYFKEYKSNYSIVDLSNRIGCSIGKTMEYLENLINKELLIYESDLLRLTLKGRITIFENSMDNYSFEQNTLNGDRIENLTVEQVYCPHEFSKEKWRENCQM